jgi:hypothetical protein
MVEGRIRVFRNTVGVIATTHVAAASVLGRRLRGRATSGIGGGPGRAPSDLTIETWNRQVQSSTLRFCRKQSLKIVSTFSAAQAPARVRG